MMTSEKAIELLHRLQDEQFDGVHGDERREALDMAVRALFSQQIVNDSQGLVNDCISRKMAIEAFEPEHDTDWYTPQIIEVLEALPPVQPTQTNADSTQSNTLDCVSRRAAMIVIENSGLDDDSKDTVVRVLEQLPSAQTERKKGKWIPVDSFSAFGGDEAMWMAHGNPVAFYYCSECKEQAYAGEDGESLLTDFCPSCGARME